MKWITFLILNFLFTLSLNAQQVIEFDHNASKNALIAVRDQIREINGSMSQDIVILLGNGTYQLDTTLVLTNEDAGTNGYRVIWRAATPGKVHLSGGTVITGWSLHDPENNIWKAKVSAKKFRQIYVDGERRTRARTPNSDGNINLGPYFKTNGVDLENRTLTINKSEIREWANFRDVEMVFYPSWYHNRLHLSSYEVAGQEAKISFNSNTDYAFRKDKKFYINAPYFFENAYEYLDLEGEWYLSSKNNFLYYKPLPGEDMEKVKVVAPQIKTLVSIYGKGPGTKVKNITFEGITFSHSTWTYPSDNGLVLTQAFQPQPMTLEGSFDEAVRPPGAVRVDFGESINFYRNTFTQLGANGLCYFIGNTNCEIDHNTFEYISGNGLVIDEYNALAPKPEHQTMGFKVTNNYIQYMGMDYTNGIGILANRVSNLIIENNTITNLPYTAIQIGNQPVMNKETATENISISYNYISNFTNIHSDGGAIYTLGDQPGCVIRENYIHDWDRPEYESKIAPSAGVYLDNYSRFMVVERNKISGYSSVKPRMYDTFIQTTTKDFFLIDHPSDDACIMKGAGVDNAINGCLMSCKGLVAPNNLKIEFNTLTWDKVRGAKGYIVWMSSDEKERYTRYQDVGDNAKLSLSAKYYAVQAYGSQPGCKSDLSSELASKITTLNGRVFELEECDYINMIEDESLAYFNHKGLQFNGQKGESGVVVFMHGWPTDNFKLKVTYLAAQKGVVHYELRVAGKLVDSWDSRECEDGVCVRITELIRVEKGDEVRLNINPDNGASGQVDYLEMIPAW